MQALCQACNRKKGMAVLRQHQQEIDALCRDILASRKITRVFISVTPGGGKSAIPIIVAARLIPRFIDAICWVVPRQSLQEQAERNFLDTDFRRIIGHQYEIRASTNDVNPCRGKQGYSTTYQAISEAPKLHTDEFAIRRYALILDEPHHLKELGPWHKSIQPLVDRARIVFFMSGTWDRGDGNRIAFIPYSFDPQRGGYSPEMPTNSDTVLDTAFVRYGRGMALSERAVKSLRFHPQDGPVEWIDRTGQNRSVESLAASGDYAGDALTTALHTEYAHQILHRTVQEWMGYRMRYPWAKLLIVAKGIEFAKDYIKQLRPLGVTRAEIATSDDSQAAREAIKRYKEPNSNPAALDTLVTVAMAYEGLDVPAITHIACLTHIRSTPWIEQMAARASRVMPPALCPYEEQVGHIFGPDDPLLHECFAKILAEQEPFIKAVRARDYTAPGPDVPIGDPKQIMPIAGQVTRERILDLTAGDGIGYEETARLQAALQQVGLHGMMDAYDFKRAMDAYTAMQPQPAAPAPPSAPASERERAKRRAIDDYTHRYEGSNQLEWGTLNGAIIRAFRKQRKEMTEAELERVWVWLNEQYPM
jgi:superfamily II DNA or RNA helicase